MKEEIYCVVMGEGGGQRTLRESPIGFSRSLLLEYLSETEVFYIYNGNIKYSCASCAKYLCQAQYVVNPRQLDDEFKVLLFNPTAQIKINYHSCTNGQLGTKWELFAKKKEADAGLIGRTVTYYFR